MSLLRIFIGYEPRQPIAYTVLNHSIVINSSRPVSITPLILSQLPIKRRGLTEFTFSRFLVPWLCGYSGYAVFMDADIVVTGDINDLFECAFNQPGKSVYVMSNQPAFERSSVMVFNCEKCLTLTPEFIENRNYNPLALDWPDENSPSGKVQIGEIPEEWNHCVGYQPAKKSKLYHFTQGIPWFDEVRGRPEDVIWDNAIKSAFDSVSWEELMGASVHAKYVRKSAA